MSKIKVGIIGGSGLDNPDILKDRKEKKVTTPFGEPSDMVIEGTIGGVPCMLVPRHGKKHDKMPGNVNYRANIWAFKQEGCTHIVATNACGSLTDDMPPGTLVVVDKWLDRTTNRKQTFYDGETGHPPGVCHMPMEPAFHPKLRQVILETACAIGKKVKNGGCIVAIEGPRYSSLAESNLYRQWGAHLVGMTTVPEVVLAKEAGLIYATICMSTDWDCWKSGTEQVSHKGVEAVFKANAANVLEIIKALIPRMAKEDWSKDIEEARGLAESSVVGVH